MIETIYFANISLMEVSKARRESSRSKSPDKSATAFLTQLKESRQAFDVFKSEAERKGFLGKK